MTWIEWFCSLHGNEGVCIVPQDFICDQFNLTGLRKTIDNYEDAFDVLTGRIQNDKKIDKIAKSVIELYSILHQRFVASDEGLECVKSKYDDHVYGVCPRYYCNECHLLPVGLSNEPGRHIVKYYCPCCKDIYVPSDKRESTLDGCFFGPSFPMEFLIHYPECVPREPIRVYEPKLYGFSIHEESKAFRQGRFDDTVTKQRKRVEESDDDV
ncbi:Casein kinase II subunit beta [Blastocystis sp. ATCC 50177/Nand II]|uniref:Casein kinase II subunit beta n=1 Tax=Blastocystis sp. subtype 1 (strain ATCC 50177 / NandII) TaxID=478820 RepID=A0A196SFS8_BLAHN|nr:Casein kinase II subunit beta [Blastocystis sp. ATCC 50177/Nand II]